VLFAFEWRMVASLERRAAAQDELGPR
jgi:hypothetical protein